MDLAQANGLASSWMVRAAAGEPCSVVRVRNLQGVVQGPQDAWGREGKLQPVLVSAEVSFTMPFDIAASADNVTSGDTVHYGTLSKAILATLETLGPQQQQGDTSDTTLRGVLERIWSKLTGRSLAGEANPFPDGSKPLLDLSKVRLVSVTVCLPKASLLGEGVSLTGTSLVDASASQPQVNLWGVALKLHRLRVPTLIGVNSNERLSKQFVIADVELDQWDYPRDIYTLLENFIVEEMDKSSFETLEALGTHVCNRILGGGRGNFNGIYPEKIKMSLEKPTAVPFAECPVVEIRVGVTHRQRNTTFWPLS